MKFSHKGKSSEKLSNIQIFSIERIDRFLNKKNESEIKNDEFLDMKNYCDCNISYNNYIYTLFAKLNHEGDLNEGHYYSIIKIKDSWLKFNDSIITNEVFF